MQNELSGSDSSVKKRRDICKKLARYLSWCGFNTKVFNVGNRRRVVDNVTKSSETGTSHDAKFFDHSNAEAASLREKVAAETLNESIEWLKQGGKVAIHDMKLQGPDYINMDPEEALKDFRNRISNYEKVYQTISDEEESRNLRHGESLYNMVGRLGGDSSLSANGKKYAEALYEFIENREMIDGEKEFDRKQNDSTWSLNSKVEALRVFTSTLKRTLETAEKFEEDPEKYEISHIKFLNEIYAGAFEDMTYEEIKLKHPDEYLARQEQKLQYRYPGAGGESYLDVIERLRPVIIELERMRVDALVVTHQVVMRTLLAYFTGIPLCDVPKVKVPLHTLYCLQPKPYGADLHRYAYDPKTGKIEYQGEGYEFV
ncbi:hypothetical protein HK103_007423 [Boothiomyces macroporosus]|uniref:6-phosphofructo-2-kinase domain-containing protein n=1 Tax=Boothiomyces macroporosus TaxID=261099 RepID=A0AAD5UKX5_9FUNG|nr:hypothetical protein HK103_007423 [Boothiomyces macroporosus]